jgi:hypothetical protein
MNGRHLTRAVVILLAFNLARCDDHRVRGAASSSPEGGAPSSTVLKRLGGYLPRPDAFQWIDGRRRAAVSNGYRVIQDPHETKVIDATPVGDLGGTTFLPAPVGGGVLFISATTVHYASTFEGRIVGKGSS